MNFSFKLLAKRFMKATPFDIRRRLPEATLDPLNLLLSIYEARQQKTTVIQVGACDGFSNDPIRHHVGKNFLHAILIEPNPYAFSRLQKTYEQSQNVTLVRAAIGEKDGIASLYRAKKMKTEDSEIDLTLQVASFYKKHLEQHGLQSHQIERIDVPCRSLQSIVNELNLSKLDLLQIDAEGFDATIVRMALEMSVLPECINFEHIHLTAADRQPLFDRLRERDYLLGFDRWNILAVQRRSAAGNQ
jgi:FkbM family methyltransferase